MFTYYTLFTNVIMSLSVSSLAAVMIPTTENMCIMEKHPQCRPSELILFHETEINLSVVSRADYNIQHHLMSKF
jgi:hypothetical protein